MYYVCHKSLFSINENAALCSWDATILKQQLYSIWITCFQNLQETNFRWSFWKNLFNKVLQCSTSCAVPVREIIDIENKEEIMTLNHWFPLCIVTSQCTSKWGHTPLARKWIIKCVQFYMNHNCQLLL